MDHTHQLRVYYEDTDASGIVYHASYLKFAERGRTEMLRAAGLAHARLLQDTGIAFAVVKLNIEYKIPARLDDLLVVRTAVASVSGASMEMEQSIHRNDTLICRIYLMLACIDRNGKAVRLPASVREILA
jgi:acyl-CoA thioester hydrolase